MPVAELRRTRIPSRPEIWSRIAPFFIVDYGEHVGRIYLSP
jgi:hypothetical protein